MGGPDLAGADEEIRRMQEGVRNWVRRTARLSGAEMRKVSAPVLLSLLCASAFCPLLAVGAGITGAAAVAGIGVLSSAGSGILSGVIASAIDRLRPRDKRATQSPESLEDEIAGQIQALLEAGDERTRALRAEIAVVLKDIDAGGAAVRSAIEAGNERVCAEVIKAISELGDGFAELGFLMKDVEGAAAQLQQTLDKQSVNVQRIMEQNYRQSTDIRLVRETLATIERQTRTDTAGIAASNPKPRWLHGCPYRGLLPFEEGDEDIFYGRERLTTELAVTLAGRKDRSGIVVVTGASGAGKSSLLRAGLLPTLARGVQLEGSEEWLCKIITPTVDPLAELASALVVLGGGDVLMIRDRLAQHPDQAHLLVQQAIATENARRANGRLRSSPASGRLVLIVDQFEQVFTLDPSTEGEVRRQAFITALCAAATNPAGPGGRPSALVVIAVRGDFWVRVSPTAPARPLTSKKAHSWWGQ